jgi:hypothetical protein
MFGQVSVSKATVVPPSVACVPAINHSKVITINVPKVPPPMQKLETPVFSLKIFVSIEIAPFGMVSTSLHCLASVFLGSAWG